MYDPVQLTGKHKKFDKELFDKYDTPARQIIKEKLKDFVCDNPNIYEQDLVITKPDCKYKYIEIQVCTSWLVNKMTYDSIYIFERKIRFSQDTLFIVLNSSLTKACIFDRESLNDIEPRRIKKYSRYFVYDVPWNRIMQFCIDLLEPETIMLY